MHKATLFASTCVNLRPSASTLRVKRDDLSGKVLHAQAQGLRFQHLDGPAKAQNAFARLLKSLKGQCQPDPALGVGRRGLVNLDADALAKMLWEMGYTERK